MKKAVSSRKRRTKTSKNQEVKAESMKILRTVGDNEAFYFFEDLGRPTGKSARNLPDFLDKVKSVKLESLIFHLQRNDFQNWIEKILGDSKLVRRLEGISSSNKDEIRMRLCSAVEDRIKELKESYITLVVGENAPVLLRSH